MLATSTYTLRSRPAPSPRVHSRFQRGRAITLWVAPNRNTKHGSSATAASGLPRASASTVKPGTRTLEKSTNARNEPRKTRYTTTANTATAARRNIVPPPVARMARVLAWQPARTDLADARQLAHHPPSGDAGGIGRAPRGGDASDAAAANPAKQMVT